MRDDWRVEYFGPHIKKMYKGGAINHAVIDAGSKEQKVYDLNW